MDAYNHLSSTPTPTPTLTGILSDHSTWPPLASSWPWPCWLSLQSTRRPPAICLPPRTRSLPTAGRMVRVTRCMRSPGKQLGLLDLEACSTNMAAPQRPTCIAHRKKHCRKRVAQNQAAGRRSLLPAQLTAAATCAAAMSRHLSHCAGVVNGNRVCTGARACNE